MRKPVANLLFIIISCSIMGSVPSPETDSLENLLINAREDTLAALRAELGLDRPAWLRYLLWLLGLVQGVTLGAPGDVTHQTAEDEQQDEANGDDYLDL